MTKHEIIQLFINNLPAIIATFGVIFSVIKILIAFKKTSDDIKTHTDYSKLCNDLAIVIQENYELKKQLAEKLANEEDIKQKLEDMLLINKELEDDTNRQEDQI